MAAGKLSFGKTGLQHEKKSGTDNAGPSAGSFISPNFYRVCHLPGCGLDVANGVEHFCSSHRSLDQLRNVLFGQHGLLVPERIPLTAVYLVGSRKAGAVKVGVADNVHERVAALQTGAPFRIEVFGAIYTLREHAFRIERATHDKLREFDFHLSGEWFDAEPEDVYRLIAKMADAQGLAWLSPGKYLDLIVNPSGLFADVTHYPQDVRLVVSAMLATSILAA